MRLQAVAILSVLAAVVTVAHLQWVADPSAGVTRSRYRIGDRLVELPDRPGGNQGTTIAIMVKSTCSLCTWSMPYYVDLARSATETRVVILGRSDDPGFVPWMKSVGVVDFLVLGGVSAKMPVVPAVFAVDEAGVIEALHWGRMFPEQEQEWRVRAKAREGAK
jgi:hypothetical protein